MEDLRQDPNPSLSQSTSSLQLLWKERIANNSETPVLAETSYGCQKQIIELYVYDYGRKGFMETRSVRLPTVAIRPGAVSPRPLYPHIVELMEAIICSIIIHLWSN